MTRQRWRWDRATEILVAGNVNHYWKTQQVHSEALDDVRVRVEGNSIAHRKEVVGSERNHCQNRKEKLQKLVGFMQVY